MRQRASIGSVSRAFRLTTAAASMPGVGVSVHAHPSLGLGQRQSRRVRGGVVCELEAGAHVRGRRCWRCQCAPVELAGPLGSPAVRTRCRSRMPPWIPWVVVLIVVAGAAVAIAALLRRAGAAEAERDRVA